MSVASTYGGWLIFSYAIMQFLFAPVLGGLSDRFGRRPVLLFSLLGLGIDYVFQAFAPTIFWLFVGRIFAGITGASFTTATAYIADISTPEKRAQNFGMVGAAFGLGFIIGPVIGGLVSQWGSHIPFLVAAGFSFINLIYGFFVLPESLKLKDRRRFEVKRANPFGSLTHLKKYPIVAGLIGAFVLLFIASHSVQSNWAYFTMYKFQWDEKLVGYSLGFVGLMVAIVQGGLIRFIIPKIGQTKSIYLGLVLNAVALLLFSFVWEGWMMYAVLVPYALAGIAGPALQGVISAQVPANEQGELQGALTSLVSITSIVGPPLMNNLFAYFTSPSTFVLFPGAPFALGAVLVVISLVWSYKTLSKNSIH